MMAGRRRKLWIVVASLTALLVSCGGAGAGGGGDTGGTGNQAPTVEGTFTVNAVVGETVSFDVTATDPEGQGLTYQWGLVQSPDESTAASTVSGADTLGASFVPDVVGTYVAELLVSDGSNQAVFEFTINVTQGAPDEPSASNPANGATNVPVGVTLEWDSDGASEYRVYLGTSDPPGEVPGGPFSTNSYDPPEDLDYSTEYFWRIDAINGDGTTEGGVWSFTTEEEPLLAPGEPSNPTPAHMATGVAIDSNLSWSSSGADTFDVYFGTSANPQTLIANENALSSVDPSPGGDLDYSTTYYWRVVAENGGGSTEGQTWRFTTEGDPNPAPGPFNLLAPADGSSGLEIPITLTWGQSADATGYRVFLGSTNNVANATQVGTTNAQTRTFVLDDLPTGVQRYWWVQAFNNDDPEETRLAGPFDFRTLSPPGSFDIISPTGDRPTVPLPVTIDWAPSAEAASYTVTIANDRSGATIEKRGITATQWQVRIGEPEGVDYDSYYSVVVTAVNAAGSTDMDTGSQRFRTESEPVQFPTDAAAHWPLGESDFKDLSGNGHNGMGYPTGAPPRAISGRSGSTGGGHAFNGEGQHVQAPVESQRSPLLDYSKGFALSLWIDGASSVINGRGFVAQLGSGNEVGFALYGSQTTEQTRVPITLLAFFADGGQVFSVEKSTLPQQEWFHVVVNYDADGGIIDLWVNGKVVGQNQGTITAAGDVYIGTLNNEVGYLAGGLDDVRIFNRTLTAEEIGLLLEE